jgi:hypothetical protein
MTNEVRWLNAAIRISIKGQHSQLFPSITRFQSTSLSFRKIQFNSKRSKVLLQISQTCPIDSLVIEIDVIMAVQAVDTEETP